MAKVYNHNGKKYVQVRLKNATSIPFPQSITCYNCDMPGLNVCPRSKKQDLICQEDGIFFIKVEE
jgi:hypothetical protein